MLTIKQIESLNELETLVFDYISTHEKEILTMKLNDLANEIHVSTTTILRFCKKAGCNGFSEFKIKYRLYLEVPQNQHYAIELHSLLDYFNKVNKEDFDQKLEKTAEILATKKNIIFIGIGGSGILAKYASYLFNAYEINCTYYDDPFSAVPNISFCQDAVFILSISGFTQQLVEKAYKYREKQAYVIAITNREDSPLVKCANESYHHYIIEEKYNWRNTTTQIPTMFIIESLASKTKKILENKK